MSDRIQMRELAETDEAGIWVDAGEYGTDLPSETGARFVLQRTAKGLWNLAVRGYNSGEQLESVVTRAGELAVKVGDSHYPTLDQHHGVIPVDPDTAEEYMEAVKLPETLQGLLVQVLENAAERKQSGWNVMGPAEYNDYDTFARLVIFGEGTAGLAWQEGEVFGFPLTSEIVQEGPNYQIRPYDRRVRCLSTSAVADRVANYPTQAWPNPLITVESLDFPDLGPRSPASALYGSPNTDAPFLYDF